MAARRARVGLTQVRPRVGRFGGQAHRAAPARASGSSVRSAPDECTGRVRLAGRGHFAAFGPLTVCQLARVLGVAPDHGEPGCERPQPQRVLLWHEGQGDHGDVYRPPPTPRRHQPWEPSGDRKWLSAGPCVAACPYPLSPPQQQSSSTRRFGTTGLLGRNAAGTSGRSGAHLRSQQTRRQLPTGTSSAWA